MTMPRILKSLLITIVVMVIITVLLVLLTLIINLMTLVWAEYGHYINGLFLYFAALFVVMWYAIHQLY